MLSSSHFIAIFPLILGACSTLKTTSPPIVEVRLQKPFQLALTSIEHTDLSISFEQLPQRIRSHNISLAAARKLVAEASGKLQSSGLRANDELQIEFETSGDFRDFLLTVGLSRKYPRTNKLLIEKQISAILVEAAQAEVRDVERLTLGKARSAFVKVQVLQKQRQLLEAQQENALGLAAFIKDSANKGEASPLEAATALLEASRLKNLTQQVDIQTTLALATLKPLLGLSPKAKLTLKGKLPIPSIPEMKVSSAQRPDLQAAHLRTRSANTAEALALARDRSDLEAGIFAGLGREEDAPNGTEAEQIIGIRFKFPLGPNPATPGRLAQANAQTQRLSLSAQALQNEINAEAHAAYAEMKQWQLLATEIKNSLLPLAQTQITQTETAYKRGEIPLRDVLRAREQKLELETTHLEAQRDFHFARVNYLTATAQ